MFIDITMRNYIIVIWNVNNLYQHVWELKTVIK